MPSKIETSVDSFDKEMQEMPGLKQFNEWLANKMLENWLANEKVYIKQLFSEYVGEQLKNIRGYYKEWVQLSLDFPEKDLLLK